VQREQDALRRRREREAAADERERKRLYIEDGKAEAADMTDELHEAIADLDSVLADGIADRVQVSFEGLKSTVDPRPFDAAGRDAPHPPPDWAAFAPKPPGRLGRALGSAAKQERLEADAVRRYDQALTEHAEAEAERRRQLEEESAEHGRRRVEAEEHNAEVDAFERAVRAGESEPVAGYFTLILDEAVYPEGFPHQSRLIYETEPRHLVVDYELPPQELVPVDREYRYVQTRDEIDALSRPAKEIRQRYTDLIAQVALRTLDAMFSADAFELLDAVTFNGRLSTIDKATGQPIRPHLITVTATREAFATLVLADLDPTRCLRHLNALVSPHPYDMEEVKPLVDFDAMLARYKLVEGMDAIADLDSRPDLLEMTPGEFEHFTRQLFEAMGMKAWTTQETKDDGVDAVATNEDPVFGGLCVIQAKRYRGAVGVSAMRELAGVMEDKHATKGILVTTSWVTRDGHELAHRHGRMQVIDGENLKYLCREHLDLDILIGLPKAPPKRRRPPA
jgi:restriction system protein